MYHNRVSRTALPGSPLRDPRSYENRVLRGLTSVKVPSFRSLDRLATFGGSDGRGRLTSSVIYDDDFAPPSCRHLSVLRIVPKRRHPTQGKAGSACHILADIALMSLPRRRGRGSRTMPGCALLERLWNCPIIPLTFFSPTSVMRNADSGGRVFLRVWAWVGSQAVGLRGSIDLLVAVRTPKYTGRCPRR